MRLRIAFAAPLQSWRETDEGGDGFEIALLVKCTKLLPQVEYDTRAITNG